MFMPLTSPFTKTCASGRSSSWIWRASSVTDQGRRASSGFSIEASLRLSRNGPLGRAVARRGQLGAQPGNVAPELIGHPVEGDESLVDLPEDAVLGALQAVEAVGQHR